MKLLNGLISSPEFRDAECLAELLPLVVMAFVERVDGAEVTLAEADVLAEDAELTRGLLVRIRTMLDALREQGAVFALCPFCGLWEAEVSVNAFALAIAEPLPSTFDGSFLAFPSMSTNLVAGPRPALPRAARFRVETPSLALGLAAPWRAGVLGQVEYLDSDFEDPAWLDDPSLLDDDSPIRDGPTWRAMSRLAHALEPPLTDEQVDEMPCVDFFFFDLVQYLVERAPVRPDTAGLIRCQRCDKQFLPVRRDYRA